MQGMWVWSLVREFPDSSVGKESACNAGDPGSIPGSGRSPGEGIVYPVQYSWASLVAWVVKNLPATQETWVDPWVGKIPWRRECLPISVFWPGEFHGLYSHRVRHDWATFTFTFRELRSHMPCGNKCVCVLSLVWLFVTSCTV